MPPDCTPKKKAWIEKIIAEKRENALRAGLSEQEWMKIEAGVSKHGLRTWIDLRSETTHTLRRVPLLTDLPPLQGTKSDKQAAYAEKTRFLRLLTEIDQCLPYPLIPDPEVKEKAVCDLIREIGSTETSAKNWLDQPWEWLLERVRLASDGKARETVKDMKVPPATSDMVVRLIQQGINPDVARRAGELQDAIRAIGTDREITGRIRTLVLPLAKDSANAANAANDGRTADALALLDQAFASLRKIQISSQIERLIAIAPSAEAAEEVMNRLDPAVGREEYEYVSRELETAIKNFSSEGK